MSMRTTKLFKLTVVLLSIMLMPVSAFATWPDSGWAWYYNDKPSQQCEENKAAKAVLEAFGSLSPLQQTQVLRRAFLNAIDRAKFNPTDENIERALRWQMFFVTQASDFTQGTKQTLIKHPDLDYEVTHPQSSAATNIVLDERSAKEDRVIRVLAAHYWMYVFYRGRSRLDQLYVSSLVSFTKTYGFEVVGVPVDGRALKVLGRNIQNDGLTTQMQVKALPGVFLVNITHHVFNPVIYGFHALDEVKQSFYNVGVNFKRWW